MCLIVFDWRLPTPGARAARFTLAANRDEFFSRRATPMDWWHDAPQVLAGRDLQSGSTWLGVHRDGRFAALTNYRAAAEKQLDGPSRGRLVADFLSGPQRAPLAYLEQLARAPGINPTFPTFPASAASSNAMRGFNLLAGNLLEGELAYFSNRSGQPPRLLPPGCYGLSNALLDTAWPKVQAKKAELQTLLELPPAGAEQLDALLTLMQDTGVAPDNMLPDTGLTLERERALSAAYIVSPGYGTRCTTALHCSASGHIDLVERGDSAADGTRSTSGMVLGRYGFQLEPPIPR